MPSNSRSNSRPKKVATITVLDDGTIQVNGENVTWGDGHAVITEARKSWQRNRAENFAARVAENREKQVVKKADRIAKLQAELDALQNGKAEDNSEADSAEDVAAATVTA